MIGARISEIVWPIVCACAVNAYNSGKHRMTEEGKCEQLCDCFYTWRFCQTMNVSFVWITLSALGGFIAAWVTFMWLGLRPWSAQVDVVRKVCDFYPFTESFQLSSGPEISLERLYRSLTLCTTWQKYQMEVYGYLKEFLCGSVMTGMLTRTRSHCNVHPHWKLFFARSQQHTELRQLCAFDAWLHFLFRAAIFVVLSLWYVHSTSGATYHHSYFMRIWDTIITISSPHKQHRKSVLVSSIAWGPRVHSKFITWTLCTFLAIVKQIFETTDKELDRECYAVGPSIFQYIYAGIAFLWSRNILLVFR